jgi:hypothetical protein
MRNEIKSQIERIKDSQLKYSSDKSKENKKELEYLINQVYDELVRGTANKEEIEENTYIISNVLPIEIKSFNSSWYISSLLLEIPQVELNKSLWSILIKGDLIKKSTAKRVDYTISPFSTGLDKIFKKIVSDDDLNPKLQGINFEDGTATGTDAHKLLHIVADNNSQVNYETNGNYYLVSDMEKIYNKYNKDETDKTFKEYYEKVGDIGQKFPIWIKIVPQDYLFYKSFDLDYLNSVLLTLYKNKLANTQTNAVAFEFDTKDGKFHIGFNTELLSNLCESMIMAGERMVNFYFISPTRGIVIMNQQIKFPKIAKEDFYMKNNFGLAMPVMLDESSVNEGVNYPLIKYNDTYDFDIRIGASPSYNLVQGENKTNAVKENKTESKSDTYRQLIEGYELALEIETDKKKIKMYNDLIEGYELALELE